MKGEIYCTCVYTCMICNGSLCLFVSVPLSYHPSFCLDMQLFIRCLVFHTTQKTSIFHKDDEREKVMETSG